MILRYKPLKSSHIFLSSCCSDIKKCAACICDVSADETPADCLKVVTLMFG